MTRVALALIIIAALAGVIWGATFLNAAEFTTTLASLIQNVPPKQLGSVVYAVKDLPDGSEIAPDAVAEKQVEIDKIPVAAMTTESSVIGNLVTAHIKPGEIVTEDKMLKRSHCPTYTGPAPERAPERAPEQDSQVSIFRACPTLMPKYPLLENVGTKDKSL